MNLTSEEKSRLKAGDQHVLKLVLSRELENIKGQLLVFKPVGSDFDNVLKGKGSFIKELLDLLG